MIEQNIICMTLTNQFFNNKLSYKRDSIDGIFKFLQENLSEKQFKIFKEEYTNKESVYQDFYNFFFKKNDRFKFSKIKNQMLYFEITLERILIHD